jgi:hypothetical protein
VDKKNTVVYLLHAGMVEPQTRMQQWHNRVIQPASKQWLGKYTSAQAQ